MRRPILAVAAGLAFVAPVRAEPSDPFGSQENSGAALIGILYDFKQDQKRQPTGARPENFTQILGEFFRQGWDETVLNRYYRATRPLYTTQLFIPEMGADHAPRAVGVEKLIRPSNWVIVYKGQVSAPTDGRYRFLAYADDLIAVAVNNRLVVLAGRPDSVNRLPIWSPPPQGPRVPAANGHLVYGDWLDLRKDQPFDLDVLVGERPGGKFSAFLLFEKEGSTAPEVFQLAPAEVPLAPAGKSVPFRIPRQPWVGLQ